MRSVALAEAQSRLAELLDEVAKGEEIVITRDNRPVARLAPARKRSIFELQPASLGGLLKPFSPDDDILDEMLQGGLESTRRF